MKKILVFCLLAVSLICAQPVSVKVKTESRQYLIGDYIKLFVTVTKTPDVKYTLPTIKDSLAPLEYISKDTVITKTLSDGRTESEYRFTFAAYDSADVYLHSFTIPYTIAKDTGHYSIKTDSIFLTIRRIAVDTSAEIKDIKAPVREPFNWLMLIIIILIVAAAGFAGYHAYQEYFRKNKKEKPEPIIIKTPYEIALERLKALEEKKLWQAGEIKEYHSEITDIIRRYFEIVFHFPALEVTSGEIILHLKNANAPWDLISTTDEFLSNADMVKFAKFTPLPHINMAMMEQAYKIIEGEKDRLSAKQQGGAHEAL
jgi:hypothetical protein